VGSGVIADANPHSIGRANSIMPLKYIQYFGRTVADGRDGWPFPDTFPSAAGQFWHVCWLVRSR